MERPILTERTVLASIPVLHIRPRGLQGPAPTILWQHGWSSSKESHVIAGEALAAEGFRVLIPDAARHGEREPFADYDAMDAMVHFWEIVFQTVEEHGALAAEAVRLGLAMPGRFGVGGSSMGGMIAAAVLARFPWVRAAALCNGCPSLTWVANELRVARQFQPLAEEERAVFRQYDPEENLDRLEGRPLLLLHGDADTVVPVQGARRFLELARSAYTAQPERLQLVEMARLDHYVTAGMIELARNWFLTHV